MKLSDLFEKLREKAAEIASKDDAPCEGVLHASFCFSESATNGVLVGACADADIDFSCPIIKGAHPSTQSYVTDILRLCAAKELYIDDIAGLHPDAKVLLGFYYPDKVPVAGDNDEQSDEKPWMEVFLAVSGLDDDTRVTIENALAETIVSFFGDEYFRFEVY